MLRKLFKHLVLILFSTFILFPLLKSGVSADMGCPGNLLPKVSTDPSQGCVCPTGMVLNEAGDNCVMDEPSSGGIYSGEFEFLDDVCSTQERAFLMCLIDNGANIEGTSCNIILSTFTNIYTATTGVTLDETMGCSKHIGEVTGVQISPVECSGTSTDTCDELTNNLTASSGKGSGEFALNNDVAGSFFGFAYLTENYLYKEPLPVNMAYFWNRSIENVPVVNKAFAASSQGTFGHALVDSTFEVWKISRNLSYALIAIIMLITGILIILRKKISSQVVVTIQYALPKIVVGLFLVTFSYPIGAAIASIGWTLFHSGPAIAASLFGDITISNLTITAGSGVGLTIVGIIIAVLITGAATGSILLVVIIVLLGVLMWFFYLFKSLTIYLKMIFSILSAPLEFTLGVIPGNDDKMGNWFKRMGKYAATLFLMGLVIPVGVYLSLTILSSLTTEVGNWGAILAIVLPLLVLIYSLGLAIGMDKRLDVMFGDAKKR